MYTPIANFPLTESRIATLVRAQSLAEAQHMGLIDSIVDFFRGGIKRAAIEQIYMKIVEADHAVDGGCSSLKQLARFRALQGMIRSEHLDKLQIHTDCDLAAQTWQFEFRVAGTCIASAYRIPYRTGHDFAAFQDAAVMNRVQCLVARKNRELDTAFDARDGVRARQGQINDPASRIGASEAGIATRFGALAERLLPIQARYPEEQACQLDIDIDGRLYYLKVDHNVVHSGVLPAAHEDHQGQFVAVVAAIVSLEAARLVHDPRTGVTDLDQFVARNVACMVDGTEAAAHLDSLLDDPRFCSDNYAGSSSSDSLDTFIADFGDTRQVFSDRSPTANELRSERLKHLLANTRYSSLRDLISQRHLGPDDNVLWYAMNPLAKLGIGDMSPHEIQALNSAIRDIKIGHTTFGELGLVPPEPPPRRESIEITDSAVAPARTLPQFA
jgi:hypothetical protein